ncbi:MAG: hypothetical protein ABI776_06960 [Nocardioidaceae bacterium]
MPHQASPGTPAPRRHRRRTQAGAAVVLVVALGVAAFALVPRSDVADQAASAPAPSVGSTRSAVSRLPVAADLLDRSAIGRLGGSRPWRVGRTDANTAGDGINMLCQGARFADPRGYAALVRTFSAPGTPRRSAVQTVEVSRSTASARRTYRTMLGWYSGCQVARLQVVGAFGVQGVGDQAEVLTLRIGDRPTRTLSVGVARTGAVTTSTVGTTLAAATPLPGEVVRLLADAVDRLCVRAAAGRCAARPTYEAVPPPSLGEEKGILAATDLPPVGRVDRPWVGTRPSGTRRNRSATTCDRADFSRAGATRVRTRTFVIPQASLPTRFGLSETYGRFRSATAASRFLAGVRRSVAGCQRRDLATGVGAERRLSRTPAEGSWWRLVTAVSSRDKVSFETGFVRVGRTVAQVTFAPVAGADMRDDVFGMLLRRAGDRLGELGAGRS